MATVLLTGATGMLGSALLERPARSAHDVRAAARRVPQGGATPGIDWRRIDVLTGEGVDAALESVEVVVHAASAPRGESQRTEVAGTERLLQAASRARVKHFVYVSIVGVDRIPLAYYRHKVAAEQRVRGQQMPWTILRGTQFFPLVDIWCRSLARSPLPVAMRGWKVQPLHVTEFADALWETVARGPSGRAPDVAGPEVLEWPRVLEEWHRAQRRPRRVAAVPIPGRLARLMREGAACAPDRAVGVLTWREWLERRYGPGA